MKTIQTDTHLLLVDEINTVTKESWVEEKGNIYQLDLGHSGFHIWNKIIAASPKLGDLPEFETLPPNTEDDVEKLAMKYCPMKMGNKVGDVFCKGFSTGFVTGYKLAKTETMFSLEDMKKAYNKGALYGDSDNTYYFDNLIQSLTKPKEYEFIVEMEEIVNMDFDVIKGEGHYNPMYIKQPKEINNKIQGIWK